MYSGYLALGGNELINSPRAAQYASALGITRIRCEQCSTLQRALFDTPYTSPDMDDAPWWDPTEPHSKEFAGLFGLDIVGLGRSVASRAVVPLADDGAALHPLRRSHKEIQVTALALAKTEAALSYGVSWLSSVLRGQVCGSGCGGDGLCFFTACPTCDPPPPAGSVDTCGDAYFRQMFNVGLLQMEDLRDVQRVPGGWLGQVQFTVAAGDPFIYRDPVLVATGPQPSQQLPNYQDTGLPPVCFESTDCLRDDDCPPPPAPILPPVPIDACFPTGPFTASRFVLKLDAGKVPIWAEKVPYIRIKTGGSKIERLTLRWYANPMDRDCTDLDPCSACAEINLAFVPAYSTLTIDGRSQTATVDCPGGPGQTTAEPALYGRGGTLFQWPVYNCDTPMCLEVITKADTVAADASMEIYYVVREDAA